MSDPVRVLHFADIHIGMENYGRIDPQTGINGRVLDFLRRLDEITQYAQDHDADLAIFAGDAFKTRNPTPTYQREFARRIKRLADICPVVLVVGNHDLPTMVQKASSVEIFRTLEVPHVIVGRSDQLHHVQTKRGPVQVATIPYPMRQRLLAREEMRGKSIHEIDQALQEGVSLVIQSLAQRLQPDIPAILAGHLSVGEAKFGSERSVMIGRDVAVVTSALADPVWDYVALGHIHRHQNLTEGELGVPPVVYSGSLERIDFGEEREPKGFCWVELLRGATRWEFVPVAARPFVTVRVDVRASQDPTAAVMAAIAQHQIDEAVVRVLIETTMEKEAELRERDIEHALAGAYYVGAIQKQVDRPARSRLGTESPESLNPLELLERYLEAKETPGERRAILLKHAEQIMDSQE
jgi:exonuclease SbcD